MKNVIKRLFMVSLYCITLSIFLEIKPIELYNFILEIPNKKILPRGGCIFILICTIIAISTIIFTIVINIIFIIRDMYLMNSMAGDNRKLFTEKELAEYLEETASAGFNFGLEKMKTYINQLATDSDIPINMMLKIKEIEREGISIVPLRFNEGDD